MDRCNGHSEEAWSAPRNGQGLHKVFEHHLWLCLWKLTPTIFLQIWVLGVLDVQRGVLRPDQTISKPGNEKTYLWRQLSPGGQPHSYEQVAQRGYVTLYQDIDLLLKRSKNVPKKSSFLKRDLDARKDSEAYRYFVKESLHHNGTLHINRESAEHPKQLYSSQGSLLPPCWREVGRQSWMFPLHSFQQKVQVRLSPFFMISNLNTFWSGLEPCTSAVISPASPAMFLASSISFCLSRCCCLANIASKGCLAKMLLNNACGLIACWDNVTFGARCVFLYRKWGMLGRVN